MVGQKPRVLQIKFSSHCTSRSKVTHFAKSRIYHSTPLALSQRENFEQKYPSIFSQSNMSLLQAFFTEVEFKEIIENPLGNKVNCLALLIVVNLHLF